MTHPKDTNEGPNPSGLCLCGCGERTSISAVTDPKRGVVRGKPNRYLRCHNSRTSPVVYIVEDRGYDTPCWVWQGARKGHGYGSVRDGQKSASAHRLYYERAHGPVPDGLELDHLCRVRLCVNPDHLEPVTHAINGQRCVTAKLTAADVAEIRECLRAKTATGRELAARFGVSTSLIGHIKSRRNWP